MKLKILATKISFQLRTEFNMLLMNLVVTELAMSVYGIPIDWLGEPIIIIIILLTMIIFTAKKSFKQ